jgi:iron complex outermembrane receptor protein
MTAAFAMKDRLRVAIALALAATAAGTASAADTTGGLEEVTVTATRRVETNLQETPISVSAVTSADIERMVAKDISGIASSVPGFSAARVTAFNAASFAMRGVGITDIIVYQDSPVGVQVDDFVMPSVQTQLLDTFDIASVEVLRGPQGTLFGKNTTGGAVQIRTKRPDMKQFGGDLRLGAAKFGEVTAQGAVDIPIISDKFALRLVGSYIKTDGYYRLGACYGPITNLGAPVPGITGTSGCGTGEKAGGQDVFNGRLKAQWNVTENLTALFQFEYMRDRSDAVPAFNDTPPGGPYLWNALNITRPNGDPLRNMGSTNRSDQLIRMNEGQEIDVDGAYVNIDWKISDSFTLYSNTGFRKQFEHLPNTYTGVAPIFRSGPNAGKPFSLFDASRDTDRDTFQQEVRLASSLDGPVNFVAGGFYQRNDARFCVVQYVGLVDTFIGGSLFNDTPQLLCNKQKSDSLAGFLDGTWDLSEKLQIGAGFRMTQDKKEWSGRPKVFFNALGPNVRLSDLRDPLDAADFAKYSTGVVDKNTPGFGNLEETWTEPSWRLTGSYKFTPDVFGYATISRGYKAGGYNDQTGTNGVIAPALTRPVDPEFATNYEVGLKTQWLDNRLRFNPTVYYVKYTDAQRAANIPAVTGGVTTEETVFYNAAKITAKGVELELQMLVTDSFMLRAASSYLDAKYDQFSINQPQVGNPAGGNGIPAFNQTFTGLPVPRSPKFSGSIMGTYTLGLASGGALEFTGEFYHEDENLYYISAVGRQYDAYLDAKNLLNASAAWTSANGQYFARLYGRNLSDRRYRIASQSVGGLWTHTQWGEPRNYGVQFGVKFGGAAAR